MQEVKEIMIQLRYRARDFQRTIQMVAIFVFVLILLYFFNALPIYSLSGVTPTLPVSVETCHAWEPSHLIRQKQCKYNSRYPFSDPLTDNVGVRFKIGAIADLDEERSKVAGEKYKWKSYFKTGYLSKFKGNTFKVEWISQITLTSRLNEKGRGLELSELCAFNGKLYTVDDRTGVVYQIKNGKVIPWVILMDGDGSTTKGFKCEWMTVKDGALFIGGLGKEWTTKEGNFINYHPLFVKSIDQYGGVVHHNWTENYLKIRAKVGVYFPGYMIHEAVMWSSVKKRWFFLPRRMSKQKYDDVVDENRGTNVLISCKADFTDLKVVYVGDLVQTHGFSSFKFVPGTNDDVALALKTKEVEGNIQSYIIVFNVNTGDVLMSEQFVANDKFEGVEFI